MITTRFLHTYEYPKYAEWVKKLDDETISKYKFVKLNKNDVNM
mgnify:CR=1 FL=1